LKVALFTLLLTFSVAPAQVQKLSADEAAIRALIDTENDAWAKYDAHKVASCYTGDSLWQNPFAVRLHGSAQLEKFLTNLFQRPGYRAAKDTAPPKILDLRFESPTVATVWSDEASIGQISDETGKPMGARHSWYLEVVVKKDGIWKIREAIISDQKQP
jgi:uncharacterized protein (TIGR02246 family)